jgi:2,4-dienoyl-CoA reductase-like NADH-dependent reductase (Old Yellow Enzyme family)
MADRVSSPILQPVTIGSLQLKNRIVMGFPFEMTHTP